MHLLADEATTVTSSTIAVESKSFVPYGKVDFRTYIKHSKPTSDGSIVHDPYFEPRFILGGKFFGERLDSKFIFGLQNKMGAGQTTNTYSDAGTKFWNDFTVYKNTYISFIPQAWFFFPKVTDEVKKATKAELGLYIPMNFPIQTAAGVFALESELSGRVYLKSKTDDDDKVEVLDSHDKPASNQVLGFAGAPGDVGKVNPTGRTLYHVFSWGASYKPSFAPGLETKFLTIYETTMTPVMEYNNETKFIGLRDGSVFSKKAYTSKFEPSYQLTVKYAFTPEYSITNEFNLMNKHEGKRKYENYLSLVAKVF